MKDDWLTHFEKSGGLSTPDYEETCAYFADFPRFSNHAKFYPFGVSAQARPMYCLVIAKGRTHTPAQARKKQKAVVMIQNVIHGGEVEGKDAWMLLLREILITGELKHFLDDLVLVVIPVLNVDGHERISASNRPNQKGPLQMGWRTTAQNLDLNRDYMKADSPEMKALLQLFQKWLPDFYIDNHTTNGADFQYHVLYSIESHQNIHPLLGYWTSQQFLPYVCARLEQQGFLTAPYNEASDLRGGIINTPALPRLSTGYSALQNRLCLLVEAHSLKPYENRVHSTKAMNIAALEYIAGHREELLETNREADRDTVREFYFARQLFPLTVSLRHEPDILSFKGIESYQEKSPITGGMVTRYTGKPVDLEIPFFNKSDVTETIVVPEAYAIPQEYAALADHLRLHGIETFILDSPLLVSVERYRFREVHFACWPYESRHRPDFKIEVLRQKLLLPKGTLIVPPAQRTLRVIVQLLEPSGTDSLVRWGFFNAVFERKEYAEPFVMEPLARQMTEEDEGLREEFYRKLSEEEDFRNNPTARLEFFYERSSFFDKNEKIYPVSRIMDHAILDKTRPV